MAEDLERRSQEQNRPKKLKVLCTAYCGCGHCCCWEWGLTVFGQPKYLALGDPLSAPGTKHPLALHQSGADTLQRLQRLDLRALQLKNIKLKERILREDLQPRLFCRYWTHGGQTGLPYTGVTSTGAIPQEARPALLSSTQLANKAHLIPLRLVTGKALPVLGTVAADTRFFSFGTRLNVPQYGLAEVQDHGSAIKGQLHVDLFHRSHQSAVQWGKKELEVVVIPPSPNHKDKLLVPEAVKPIERFVRNVWGLFVGVHKRD